MDRREATQFQTRKEYLICIVRVVIHPILSGFIRPKSKQILCYEYAALVYKLGLLGYFQ
jgi:hypothetical protein